MHHTPRNTRRQLVSACLLALALVLASCGENKPGEGALAEAGYKAAAPLITALDAYHRREAKYPDDPRVVLPDFFAQAPKGIDYFYRLEQDGANYILSFGYLDSGMNICHYTPEEQKWQCSGAR